MNHSLLNTHFLVTKLRGGVTKTYVGVTQTRVGVTKTHSGVTQTRVGVTKTHSGVTQRCVGVTDTRSGVTQRRVGVTDTRSGVTHTRVGVSKSRRLSPEIFVSGPKNDRLLKLNENLADAVHMLIPVPPMSNNERQRRFRAHHPGYNRRYRHGGNANEAHAMYLKALADAEASERNTPSSIQTPADGDQLLLFPV